MKCDICGYDRSSVEKLYVNGEHLNVCPLCFETEIDVCEHCENYFTWDQLFVTQDGYRICNECGNKEAENCCVCGGVFYEKIEGVDFEEDFACEECIERVGKTCVKCGRIFVSDDLYYELFDEQAICVECVEEETLMECVVCGKLFLAESNEIACPACTGTNGSSN